MFKFSTYLSFLLFTFNILRYKNKKKINENLYICTTILYLNAAVSQRLVDYRLSLTPFLQNKSRYPILGGSCRRIINLIIQTRIRNY